MLKVKTKS